MTTSNQLTPGMTISVDDQIYRVVSSVKVTVAKGKGKPFIKAKLTSLSSNQEVEKNFKPDQKIDEVNLAERRVEFLYPEGKDFLFLDIDLLNQVVVSSEIVNEKVHYLKEGIQLKAMFYGDDVFAIELPQFLELTVVKTQACESKISVSNATKIAILETGAKVEVPLFIEAGDIIKVDTHAGEYIQRV